MLSQPTPSRALVRPPGASFAHANSTSRTPIDVGLAQAQHAEYCCALSAAGLEVDVLAPDEAFPDGCFVQDPAVVIAGRGIVGRLAAFSRQGEEVSVAEYLAERMPVHRLVHPATLEGGDVMLAAGRALVGHSERTNAAGIAQLATALSGTGWMVEAVPVEGCLHLLTGATYLGHRLILAAPEFAALPSFSGLEVLALPAGERYAANVLAVGQRVVVPAGYPTAEALLRSRGFETLPVPMSEYAKADGGVTCLSLVW
jgi:dimethylargininase